MWELWGLRVWSGLRCVGAVRGGGGKGSAAHRVLWAALWWRSARARPGLGWRLTASGIMMLLVHHMGDGTCGSSASRYRGGGGRADAATGALMRLTGESTVCESHGLGGLCSLCNYAL